MRNGYRTVIGAVTAVAVGLLIVFWNHDYNTDQGARRAPFPKPARRYDQIAQDATVSGALNKKTASALEPSLLNIPTDIQVDGEVKQDLNGELVYDRELRRVLDFFIGLSSHEKNVEKLKQTLTFWLARKGFEEGLILQVMDTLERYLVYRKAVSELSAMPYDSPGSLPLLAATFENLYYLRREHLGIEMADAFFSEQEIREQYMLSVQAIRSNKDLGSEEKQQQLRTLEQQLPEHVQTIRGKTAGLAGIHQKTAALREQNASEQEIFALREEQLGSEAAIRLAQLDEQHRHWQQRMDSYRQELEQIQFSSGLSDQDRSLAIDRLREKHFQENELIRVKALDRVQSQERD